MAKSFLFNAFPRKIHRQTPLKMIEPRKTVLLTVSLKIFLKKTNKNRTHFMAMNKWKNIHSMLYKADTPRLRSTMQNICFLISISAVTLKLMVKITSISSISKSQQICHKENSEYEQRTMHVLIRISSHRTSGSVCFFGNDRSSHSRIRIHLDPMCVYYEWVSD